MWHVRENLAWEGVITKHRIATWFLVAVIASELLVSH